MFATALALFVAPAFACDGPTHKTECHVDALEEDDDDDKKRHTVDLRLGLEGTGLPDAPSTGMYADLTGPHDAFLRAEARFTTDDRWIGRVSTGVDVLGDRPFDLRVGLFLGHVGLWQSEEYSHLAIGTDLTLGAELGRVSGAIRWVGGKRPDDRGIWHETDVSLAFRVIGQARLHGHWLGMDGGPAARTSGVGLGASVTF